MNEIYKKMIELKEKKQALEEELKEVGLEIEKVNEIIVNHFLENQITKITIADHTLYISRDIFANFLDKNAGMAALRDHGYADLVSDYVHPMRLNSLIREKMGDDKQSITETDLPEEIKKQLMIFTKINIRIRK